MKTSLKNIKFSAALLAGLFAGIIAAVANLIYDMEYRSIADLSNFRIVNPLSIFVFSTIGPMIAGMIFYEFIHYIKRGMILFEALFIVLTIAGLIVLGFSLNGYKGLLLGIGIITGLICIILIPYLSRHPNIYFEEDVA
jgi:hypothetical protein